MTIAFRSETHTTDNGAAVEIGTVTYQGRDFTALGSLVDAACGVIVAYVSERADPSMRDGRRYVLTTWDGVELAPLRLVRTWQQRCYGGRTRIYAWSAVVQGRKYSGRNAGPALLLRMRGTVQP